MCCSNLILDAWEVEDTWVYREKVVGVERTEYIRKLPETVFLNIVRALIIGEKYEMIFSENLKRFILEHTKNVKDYEEELYRIQKRRYGKEHISKEKIRELIESL